MKEGMGQICYYYKTIYRNEGRGVNYVIIIKLYIEMKEWMGQLCYYYKTIYRNEGMGGSTMLLL